jgi:hypothetical protein
MKTEQNYFISSWLIIRIFVTLSAIYPTCFLGQEYYYSNGQQVDLTTDYREIIVFFNQDVDLDSIIMSHANLLAIEKNVSLKNTTFDNMQQLMMQDADRK